MLPRSGLCLSLVLLAAAVAPTPAYAQPPHLSGLFYSRAAGYANSGEDTLARYPHEGGQFVSGMAVDYESRPGDYQQLRFSGELVYDHDEYRNADESGVILERAALDWQDGEAAIPWRFQAGDYSGWNSELTLRRGLKGLSVELQPLWRRSDALHSFQFFTGEASRDIYRDSDREEVFSGASWLMDQGDEGALLFSVMNYRDSDDLSALRREQNLASVAASRQLDLPGQELTLQSEMAFLDEKTRSGLGYFVDVRGRSLELPLAWGGRYDRHEADFDPAGADVNANSSELSGYLSYRLPRQILLRLDSQLYQDDLDLPSEKETLLTQLDLSNIRLLDNGNLNAGFGLARQTVDRGTPLTESWNYRFNLYQKLPGDIGLNHEFQYGDEQDLSVQRARERRAYRSQLNWSTRLRGVDLALRPALNLERERFQRELTRVGGQLQVSASIPDHRLQLDLSRSDTRFRALPGASLDATFPAKRTEIAAGILYGFEQGPHRLSFGSRYDWQELGSNQEAGAWQGHMEYSWRFGTDLPENWWDIQPTLAGLTKAASIPSDLSAQAAWLPLDATGSGRIDAEGLLDGMIAPVSQTGRASVYEISVYEELSVRQLMVMEGQPGNWGNVGVVIPSRPQRVRNDLSAVVSATTRRFGAPERIIEEGSLDAPDLQRALAEGRVRRQYWWRVGSGTLVVGLPWQNDGQLSVQSVLMPRAPDPAEVSWGLNTL